MKKIIILSGVFFSNLIFSQVGINTPNPQASLDIQSKGNSSSTKAMRINNSSNTEIVTVTDAGRVGIGTASPQEQLNLNKSGSGYNIRIDNSSTTPAFMPAISFIRNNSNDPATNRAIVSGQGLGSIDFSGNNGTGSNISAKIQMWAEENFTTAGANRSSILFQTGAGSNSLSTRMILKADGNVGIGTEAPTNKLDVRGSVKIVDGTQADGAIFTSDANGVGTWKTTAVTKSTVSGSFPTAGSNVLSGGGTTPKYSNISITLTPGKWIVNAGMTIYNKSEALDKSRVWLHAYLSSSTTGIQRNGFALLGPSGSNTSYAGVLTKGNGSGGSSPAFNDNELNFLSGSSMVEVTAASVTLYLLIEDRSINTWEFNPRAWENYFYAIPIN